MQKQKFLLILIGMIVFLTGCYEQRREYKKMIFLENQTKDYVEEFRIDLPEKGNYTDILWKNNRIFVLDRKNKNVMIYKESGEFEYELDTAEEIIYPMAICTDEKSNLYILDSGNNSILQYDMEYNLVKKIPLQFNVKFHFHELNSFVATKENFFISVKSYQDSENYIYQVSAIGEMEKKIEKGSMGFLNIIGENIWFTNSFYTEKQEGEAMITSGKSGILRLSMEGDVQEGFRLEEKLSLHKLLSYENKYYASALGCAGIVELDWEDNAVKVLYELPAEKYSEKHIGQMTIDSKGAFWVLDIYNAQIVKVVKE